MLVFGLNNIMCQDIELYLTEVQASFEVKWVDNWLYLLPF